jgi:hypothetical protein
MPDEKELSNNDSNNNDNNNDDIQKIDEIQKLKRKLNQYGLMIFLLVIICVSSILVAIFKSPETQIHRTYHYDEDDNDTTTYLMNSDFDSTEVVEKRSNVDSFSLYDKDGNKIGYYVEDSIHCFDKQGNKLHSYISTSSTIEKTKIAK